MNRMVFGALAIAGVIAGGGAQAQQAASTSDAFALVAKSHIAESTAISGECKTTLAHMFDDRSFVDFAVAHAGDADGTEFGLMILKKAGPTCAAQWLDAFGH